jgi:hypothetical protein
MQQEFLERNDRHFPYTVNWVFDETSGENLYYIYVTK